MPKVSVVIPVYNVEKYLGECLDSILGQTLRDIEVVCVDDGSTDGSAATLEKYARRDARVKILHQENAGAGAARNAGICAASGDYLFFCDPDDWCDRGMLRDMYRRAAKDDCDIVVAGMIRHDGVCDIPFSSYPSRILTRQPRVFSGRDACEFIFVAARANPVNKLFKRAFVSERNVLFQTQKRENDLFFSYVTLALADRIGVIDEAYYHYRMVRPGSLQADGVSDGFPLLWMDAFQAVKNRLARERLLDVFALGLMRALLGTGVRALLRRSRDEGIRLLYSVLREELLGLSGVCGTRLEKLAGMDEAVWDIVSKNPSPVPLLAFLARSYWNRGGGIVTTRAIALIRRLQRLRHIARNFLSRG